MKLRDYRKLAGVSRTAAAMTFGVSAVTWWRWETGRAIPKPEQLTRLRDWSRGAVTANDFHHNAS